MKRSALKQKSTLKRGKPLKRLGRKGAIRKQARRDAVASYFNAQGFEVPGMDGVTLARCQVCGNDMDRGQAQAHHKILRSRGGTDTLENLLICHPVCHTIFLHDGLMGCPTEPKARERMEWAAMDQANARNGLTVTWTQEQDAVLRATRARWGA